MTEKSYGDMDWKDFLENTEFKPVKFKGSIPLPNKIIMTCGMIEDQRKTGLKNGLRQLTIAQLKRVINYPCEMVLDTYNYQDGKFCPLAIGIGLDLIVKNPTNDKIFNILTNMNYKIYNTRGIPGEFYTTNRKADLLEAAQEVLEEKLKIDANQ